MACLNEWGIKTLTHIQTRAVAAGVTQGASAIVCAPTSSGKTLVGELVLANALNEGLNTLYLVSHKALAEQKFADFVERFSTPHWSSMVTVGISTGDREDGAVRCRLLVATYEKALALVLAGRVKVPSTVVIADELQLLGDAGRGASVETLCALLRQQQPHQFVGLTATVENPEELAAWMKCKTVRSATRDVDLHQSIRYDKRLYTVRFGQETGENVTDPFGNADLHGIIRKTIQDGLGPVLVFTETRREASELASAHCAQCQRAADGLAISQQLDRFSEPTESSDSLKSHAERLVTFHTADLTPDERSVIESGIAKSRFQVCFATSTLAAGVNFPFRTVIFPKLTYEFGDREGKPFDRADFRNMSGRAGRLGHHPDGRALLLPKNAAELQHANRLVSPENDRVESQLVTLSMRRTVLSLVAARAVSSTQQLTTFFQNTFFWHLILEHNPKRLDAIVAKAVRAVEWLLEHHFVEDSHSTLVATPLGKATSISGLLPETAKRFVDVLHANSQALQASFEAHHTALIHWVVTCPEFTDDVPSRFLPYPGGQMKPESSVFLQRVPHLTAWDRTNERATRCVHALGLFMQGEAERKIRYATGVTSGNLHRLSVDCAWILDGLSCISGAGGLGHPQALTNQLAMLARRVHWGAPVEALDVLRIATRQRVPGFGRQRVMTLIANGFDTIMSVVTAKKDRLVALLGGAERAEALVTALSDGCPDIGQGYERVHLQLGRDLGIEQKVSQCYQALGTDYDDAVLALLKDELLWSVSKLDDGKRQNVPDLHLTLGASQLLIECKTVTKKPPLVGKDEAFAILQKASDFDPAMKRITLAKPDFDDTSKNKAAASPGITLVSHTVFMEGLMRVLTGRLTPPDFVQWLSAPGVSDLGRLPGTPTYAEPPPA